MERKLTAILCADVYAYSRLMGQDEEATLRTLSAYRKIIDGLIENHRGRFVNSAGDSILAEFTSVVEAVNCAVKIQNSLKAENVGLPPERRMEFRIGVNLGDVMVEGEQIYGEGVNVAARLENLAEPSGICISGTVHDQVLDKLALVYEDVGEQVVKNIARPVKVWRVLLDGGAAPRRGQRRIVRSHWRGGVLSLAALAIIVGTVTLIQQVSLKPPRTSASIPPVPNHNPPLNRLQQNHGHDAKGLELPSQPSIAVLPFINQSGDREQEYFSDGITDDLIIDLARLPGLFVIARESTFTYKSPAPKLRDVSRELGVRYVLAGSVRKAAGQVRVAVQLADATTGAELWAERYNRPLRDIFVLQDEIVRRIVTTLNLELSLSQKGLVIPRWLRDEAIMRTYRHIRPPVP
jgi:adenylate cyclase